MPPVAVTVTEPPVVQVALVCDVMEELSAVAGSVMVTETEEVQLLSSVTVYV